MKHTTLALAGALILIGAGASQAQTQPQPQPHPGQPQARMEMRQMMEMHHRAMQARDPAVVAERRAQNLRDALQLRPDQDVALNAFIEAQKPPANLRERLRKRLQARRAGGEGQGKLTTPQRLDRAHARMAQAQARFDKHAQAIKTFYAQLSPSQQKAFDVMPHPGGDRTGMRRGRGRAGGPGGRAMGHPTPKGHSGWPAPH